MNKISQTKGPSTNSANILIGYWNTLYVHVKWHFTRGSRCAIEYNFWKLLSGNRSSFNYFGECFKWALKYSLTFSVNLSSGSRCVAEYIFSIFVKGKQVWKLIKSRNVRSKAEIWIWGESWHGCNREFAESVGKNTWNSGDHQKMLVKVCDSAASKHFALCTEECKV